MDRWRSSVPVVCLLLVLSLRFLPSSGFVEPARRPTTRQRRCFVPKNENSALSLSTEKGGSSERKARKNQSSGGYKFGDISRSIARKFTSSVNDVTGKDDYEFGDLSKWIDARVKDKVSDITGKDKYEFGDLSRWADASIKEKVNSFTNKTDYQVGDISKEILRRVGSGEYKLEDIILLCQILVTLGVGLTPVAASLPGKLLVNMLDYSLAQELGGRLIGAITMELDRRMKQAVTGDESYQIGDLTKKAFLKFIDKDDYHFGDITKTVLKRMEQTESSGGRGMAVTFAESAKSLETKKDVGIGQEKVEVSDIDPKILQELLEWDRALEQEREKGGK